MTLYSQAFIHAPKTNQLGVPWSHGGAVQIDAQ